MKLKDSMNTFFNYLLSKPAEMEDDDEDVEDPPEISDVRATEIMRQQMRDEFTAIMHEKFLSGEDKQFDYR